MRAQSSISCGPFDLLEVIGQGGMAKVWRGVHRGQQIPVAVKVITGAKANNLDYQQRFEREVQAVAGLDHPGIVTVFDYGSISALAASTHADLAEGSPYLAMELARGGTLRKRNLICDWSSLRKFVFDLLDALAYAHAREVIHRDIKPENILCQIDGARLFYKLSDFGIAHAVDSGLDADTQSYDGASAGTPHYMPPEQLTGDWRDFGPWTDLYALGCLVYELVCGRRPFQNASFIRLANMHMNMPFPELEPRFAVPDELEAFVRKLVAKKPTDRFVRAADAAYALAQLPEGTAGAAASGASGALDRRDTAPIDANADTEVFDRSERSGVDSEGITDVAATQVDDPTLPFSRDDDLGFLATKAVETQPVLAPANHASGGARADIDPNLRETVEFAVLDFEPPPPLADTWRAGHERARSEQLVGVGLGLFGLRAIPLVDREAERDAIWQALAEVSEHQSLRVVSLRGEAGTGKSRLVEWMGRRAHELGAATVLRAPHTAQAGPAEGLPRMLESYFSTWSLPRLEVYKRVRARLETMVEGRGEAVERYLESQARGLTELMRPNDGDLTGQEHGPRFHFATTAERHLVVQELLAQLAAQRPVIVWLDDVLWGSSSMGLVEHLLAAGQDLPVLVLLTARTESLAEHPEAAERLGVIEGDERVSVIELDVLGAEDHAELIQRTLMLDTQLAEQVRERTGGNPLFAVQLIGDWVSRGILEVGRDGFSLRDGAVSTLPRNIHDLWLQRVAKLLQEFEADRRSDLLVALELAATLGQHVDGAEWAEVCRLRMVAPSEDLARRMIEEGLARRERGGASFVHGMLAESLSQAAERAGRAAEHHLACVRAIETLYPDGEMKTAQRRALHLIGAGRFEQALVPLKDAVHFFSDRGDHQLARHYLLRRERVCDEIGLPREDRRRVENWWVSAQLDIPLGNHESALEDAQRAADVARRHGWRVDVGHALLVVARVLRDRVQYDRALAVLDEAKQELEAVDDVIGLLFVNFALGFVKVRQGKFAQARPFLQRALEQARRCGDQPRVAEVLSYTGYVWLVDGNYARARELITEALALSEELGSRIATSSCARHLGEIARFEGKWSEAREFYRRSQQVARARGSRNQHLDALNLALVDVASGEYRRAHGEIRRLGEVIEDIGMHFAAPIIEMARAASAAGLERREECDEALEIAAQMIEDGAADRDLAWLAEITGQLAARAGWTRSAEVADQLAAGVYRELGDDGRAESLT